MDMTRAQRLILINQYRIMALLDKPNAAEHEANADVIQRGYEDFIGLNSILSDAIDKSVSGLVFDVLDMFSSLKRVIDDPELSEADRRACTYGGFDMNNEGRHYSFAKWIMLGDGRYESLKGCEMNSHMPIIETYRRMLVPFGRFKAQLGYRRDDLTLDQVRAIAAERVHPDNH